ncbi:CMD domain protein [Leifsonia poae]|uniref:CMD domain protein n=1 Tax=Leifsonia poae TaxID=110933 RepID=UPI001CBE40BA|nr:CMD domain protein [Leifsonia poae]
MTATPPDIIDQLTGTTPDSAVAALREQRPETRRNAQSSYDALFEPAFPGEVTAVERFAIAAFVAALHRDAVLVAHYDGGLRRSLAEVGESAALAETVAAEAQRTAATGPFGRYAPAALAGESTDGLRATVAPEVRVVVGDRLAAALDHTHLLVFRPREADSRALETLLAAGWSATDIVTLSQLVSFLAFQTRVVAGLRVLSTSAIAPTAIAPAAATPTAATPAAATPTAATPTTENGR